MAPDHVPLRNPFGLDFNFPRTSVKWISLQIKPPHPGENGLQTSTKVYVIKMI